MNKKKKDAQSSELSDLEQAFIGFGKALAATCAPISAVGTVAYQIAADAEFREYIENTYGVENIYATPTYMRFDFYTPTEQEIIDGILKERDIKVGGN